MSSHTHTHTSSISWIFINFRSFLHCKYLIISTTNSTRQSQRELYWTCHRIVWINRNSNCYYTYDFFHFSLLDDDLFWFCARQLTVWLKKRFFWISLIIFSSPCEKKSLHCASEKIDEKNQNNQMLTKEYRIAMPLTVQEYQIGQVRGGLSLRKLDTR